MKPLEDWVDVAKKRVDQLDVDGDLPKLKKIILDVNVSNKMFMSSLSRATDQEGMGCGCLKQRSDGLWLPRAKEQWVVVASSK